MCSVPFAATDYNRNKENKGIFLIPVLFAYQFHNDYFTFYPQMSFLQIEKNPIIIKYTTAAAFGCGILVTVN